MRRSGPATVLTQVSLCVQYGVSKGTMAWTLDVSRTCDKFWFGVTTDKDLDCNGWISDCDAAFMVSEEGEVRPPYCPAAAPCATLPSRGDIPLCCVHTLQA